MLSWISCTPKRLPALLLIPSPHSCRGDAFCGQGSQPRVRAPPGSACRTPNAADGQGGRKKEGRMVAPPPRSGGCRRWPVRLLWLAAFVVTAHGDCGPPPPLNNTAINEDPTKDSYAIGSSATYVCDEQKGYVQSPGKSNTITCQDDSTWSGIQEFCERSCKVAPRLQFGEVLETFINRNVFPVGSNVTYKCRPGYKIIRGLRKTITCLDTLQWTEIQEFCERKDCGNPGEPLNGRVQFQEEEDGQVDTKFGASVTFVCDTGFRIVGRNKRTCTDSGWNNAVPSCETVICPKPPDIKNGMHTSMGEEEFHYQNSVTYSCNSKTFSLIGEASIHCTEAGIWSGPPPRCEVISCTDPDVPNVRRTSGFGSSHTLKDSIGFECKPGFVMNGSRLIECGEDNEWHPPVPECQLVTCGSPPDITNGTHDGTEPFVYGTSVTYRCNSEEFKLTGESSSRCGIDGSWSGQTPTCRAVTCGSPPAINDGTHDGTEPFVYGTSVTYRCNSEEFKLTGELSIRCGIDGSWSGQTPSCRVVTCGSPPMIAHGTHDGTEPFAYGTSVTYRCNSEEFNLTGELPILCGIDGSWSGQIPACRAVVAPFRCDKLSIVHGEVIMVNEKTIEILCATLYVLHGESPIHCIGKNQWHTRALPECHLSQGFVAGIIILVLILILVVIICIYWYNKKKQGHYPTNEKGGSTAESMQLQNSNHAVDA